MYKNILLAADGSKHSERAADQAIRMASLSDQAVVEIMYVLDYDKAKNEVLHSESRAKLERERRSRLLAVENKFKHAAVPYKMTMKHGDPGPTITAYANEHDVDIVIIGSRGLNTLQEMVLGSVSHKVAKRVTCPVLIVK
ncbi:universal stress protein [Bacillus swezeyi]|uniref:Universal stress protein n=1 Tax=Bacillus swezeyi TaxID=1925020 RepID=A0A1R1S244_9BACI|nr:universal stress protein [Bacillus swezeyi]MEC1258882.1 universal stress protein [Bacillus swezeyi]MED2928157.1 universal stress protein [Bacillus swezeyi]MED2942419.1 universal stress protein [Bacillus swezeyi]MED2964931.1 universal stress protein [Bacillus swezeyi]MED2977963.1 universal stress protein [Bacillus swezeyi]